MRQIAGQLKFWGLMPIASGPSIVYVYIYFCLFLNYPGEDSQTIGSAVWETVNNSCFSPLQVSSLEHSLCGFLSVLISFSFGEDPSREVLNLPRWGLSNKFLIFAQWRDAVDFVDVWYSWFCHICCYGYIFIITFCFPSEGPMDGQPFPCCVYQVCLRTL